MDAVVQYFLSLNHIQCFVSNPPSSALLLCAPRSDLSQLSIFVTRQRTTQAASLENEILGTFGAHLVEYDCSRNPYIRFLITSPEGRKYILGGPDDDSWVAECFALRIKMPYESGGAQKPPNVSERIRDPFHLWSRYHFGNIIKTDVDVVVFQNGQVHSLIEIKRSARDRVGKWRPYKEDRDGYILLAELAQRHQICLKVIHHEITDEQKPAQADTLVDLFEYDPQYSFDFDQFRKNRKTKQLCDIIG